MTGAAAAAARANGAGATPVAAAPRPAIEAAWWQRVDRNGVDSLLADLDARGYALIGGFLQPDEIGHLVAAATAAATANNGRYTEIAADDVRTPTVLDAIGHAPEFRSLCRRIVGLGTGHVVPPVRFVREFRCQSGPVGGARPLRFRFASHVLTILIPVAVPANGGELWLFPNRRHLRRAYARHFLDRLLWQNGVSEVLLRGAARRFWFGATRVPLQPGQACVFWGYRTLHAERRVATAGLRATVLFHYANPHGRSRAWALLRAAHLRPALAVAARD